MKLLLARWITILALVLAPVAFAEEAAPDEAPTPSPTAVPAPPEELASPEAAMFTFLGAMERAATEPSAWSEVARVLDLSAVNEARSKQVASEIFGVLNRLGKVLERELPDEAASRRQQLTEFRYFPRTAEHEALVEELDADGEIVLASTPGIGWRFSATTCATISDLYRAFETLPIKYGRDEADLSLTLRLRRFVPKSLRGQELLGLETWQWLGLFLIILGGFTIDLSLRALIRVATGRFSRAYGAETTAETTARAARPVGLVTAAWVWIVFLPLLDLPDAALTLLLAAARVFATFAGVWAAWRLTDLGSEALASRAAQTASRFDDVLIPLLRKSLKLFISVLGVVYGAESLDIEIAPLVAGLGIGGLAFAFAAKDTIENFFGSIAVLIDRPFAVGDWIVMRDVEGTVEEIGFRSTRVRTFYNSLVTVPNAELVRATVDNYGRRRYRRWKTHVGIQYDTPPDKIVAFCEGIRELVRRHPYTRKDYFQVWLHQFSASSLDVLVYVFHEVPDWSVELRERERLFLDILRLADRLGVQFAFPTQTVHLFQEDASRAHEPAEPPRGDASSAAENEGIATARSLVRHQPWRESPPGPVTFEVAPEPLEEDEKPQGNPT